MSAMIRTMIIDDEPLAREELTRLVQEEKEFEVADEAGTGREALEKIKRQKFDVIFLDIDMPGMSGLEVASRLVGFDDPPLVVFATAYHQYAVEAFNANAMDYVLKPYDPIRLKQTFERIKERLAGQGSSKQQLQGLEDHLIKKGVLKKLVGHTRNTKDRVVIDPGEVFYFDVKYSEVIAHLGDRQLIINITLKEIIDRLDPAQFAQTHKSYLVNIDKIEKVSPMFSGNFEIALKAPLGGNIPLSRRYAKHLKSLLGDW
ncbi:MAG: LytTR family DNA-binding domain-containing protein [Candidatus Omnitrophota bacterium]|nr:LytTR family DNA-binding domain-containing protein [Candidatus Omnitrophota bacterium]